MTRDDLYGWTDRAAYEAYVLDLATERGLTAEAAEAMVQAEDPAVYGCGALFDPREFDGVTDPMCPCGHPLGAHDVAGEFPCSGDDCWCLGFRRAAVCSSCGALVDDAEGVGDQRYLCGECL